MLRRGLSGRLALVPTMGGLHEGHLALMRAARAHADLVVASVFVNPTQFGPDEDFEAYPRDEAGDLAKAESAGCDAVFLPTAVEMYRPGSSTIVRVAGITDRLCGAQRPGHFDGVCTVVSKLFHITGCDVAVFGEKDYQQLAVIRRMVRDLDLPVQIIGHPIVREGDGLAMSSRNQYLDSGQRSAALSLRAGLEAARQLWSDGERDPVALETAARAALHPSGVVDYVEARDAQGLHRVEGPAEDPLVVALAVRFGATRLIDNVVLGDAQSTA